MHYIYIVSFASDDVHVLISNFGIRYNSAQNCHSHKSRFAWADNKYTPYIEQYAAVIVTQFTHRVERTFYSFTASLYKWLCQCLTHSPVHKLSRIHLHCRSCVTFIIFGHDNVKSRCRYIQSIRKMKTCKMLLWLAFSGFLMCCDDDDGNRWMTIKMQCMCHSHWNHVPNYFPIIVWSVH